MLKHFIEVLGPMLALLGIGASYQAITEGPIWEDGVLIFAALLAMFFLLKPLLSFAWIVLFGI
jgi:hypothetical protein